MTTPSSMTVPVFTGEGAIDLVDKPVPEPGPGEVLIEVAGNAMCGTDKLQYRYGSPVTPGHETAGTVVAVGEGVSTPVGARGVVFLMGFCGSCRSCDLGHTNQCLDKHGDIGFERDGGYGPYVVAPGPQLRIVPDDVDLLDATLLLDVMGTSGHAVDRALRIRPDIESVLVTGAGPIGLGIVAMAKILLGDDVPVLITDLSDYRLQLAASMGAIPIDVSSSSIPAVLADASLGSVDVAFDATGREEARRDALDSLGKRGVLVCIGHGKGLSLGVSPDLIAAERTVMGSEYFRYDELDRNVELLRSHRDLLASIVTHTFRSADLVECFELFLSGETGKAAIVP